MAIGSSAKSVILIYFDASLALVAPPHRRTPPGELGTHKIKPRELRQRAETVRTRVYVDHKQPRSISKFPTCALRARRERKHLSYKVAQDGKKQSQTARTTVDAVWKRRGERWTRGRRVSKRSLDGEDGKGATTGRCAAKAVRREVVSAEMKMYVRVWLARLNLSLEGVEKRKRK